MTLVGSPVRRKPPTGERSDRPSKSQAKRLRILEAAAVVLAECGYADTRLSDIASAAGTFAGSIYYHFASREVLVEEVLTLGVTRTFDAVRARVEALPPDSSHRERIAAAIEAHVTFANSSDRFAAANQRLFAQVPHDIRKRQISRHRAYGAYWRKLLADARRAGEIRADLDLTVLRLQLLGAINWTVEWYRPGKRSTREIAAQLAATFFDGIAPRGP
jgi:TetR/AcrR family transcriptional regulator, cholesterol catabolism regulator